MEIKITEENLRKAHAEGCSDVKKVLETLAPDLFKVKYPCLMKGPHTGRIVLCLSDEEGIIVENGIGDPLVGDHVFDDYKRFTPIKGVKEIE